MNAQINVLLVAYAVTAVSMLAGLLAMRADSRAYWRLPVYSAMVMVLGVVLYYAALGLYAVLGAGVGCGLGRLTRKTEMTVDNPPGPRPPPR
jgi:hypothetical protein